MPRSRPMADAASRMPALRSSARSASSAGVGRHRLAGQPEADDRGRR